MVAPQSPDPPNEIDTPSAINYAEVPAIFFRSDMAYNTVPKKPAESFHLLWKDRIANLLMDGLWKPLPLYVDSVIESNFFGIIAEPHYPYSVTKLFWFES